MLALRNKLPTVTRPRLGIAFAGAFVLAAGTLGTLWRQLPATNDLPDMTVYPAGAERKAAFFSYLEPIVAAGNAAILQDRRSLQQMAQELDTAGSLSARQLERLEALAKKYSLTEKPPDPALQIQKLLRRADLVPLPLVLVQAAKESGWGTSRFAREANNLFGQWCFEAGCGIVPARRSQGAKHEVREFDSVDDAVAAYLHNINTGRAYGQLREMRAAQRRAGRKPTAIVLADGLLFYSERREAYVTEVKRMILQYYRFQQTRET